MGHRIVLTPGATDALRRYCRHRALLLAVGEQILDLADAPASVSRPSTFPHPADSQVYEFDLDDPDDPDLWHHYAVFFRYGSDEESIHVIAIGHAEHERDQ